MKVLRCDACGTVGSYPLHFTTVTVENAPMQGERVVEKHYCHDPNGGTVGCARKVLGAIREVERECEEQRRKQLEQMKGTP